LDRNIHVCDLFPAFLDTPGIQHAANYSGKILRPAPPVYDPQKVARSIVSAAQHPKKSVVIGSVTHLLRFAHFLLPTVTRSVTAKVVNAYLKKADDAPETSGNLFAPAHYGTSIHGGWNLATDPQTRKRNLITSIAVTGIATGMVVFGIVKMKKKSW
jgi:hypothetical protein